MITRGGAEPVPPVLLVRPHRGAAPHGDELRRARALDLELRMRRAERVTVLPTRRKRPRAA